MGLYIFGGDHDLYVEGSNIMIDKGKPKKTPEEYRQTNSKHRKSHRLKRPK